MSATSNLAPSTQQSSLIVQPSMISSQQLQQLSYLTFAQSTPFAQQPATLPQYVLSSQMQRVAYQQSPAID